MDRQAVGRRFSPFSVFDLFISVVEVNFGRLGASERTMVWNKMGQVIRLRT